MIWGLKQQLVIQHVRNQQEIDKTQTSPDLELLYWLRWYVVVLFLELLFKPFSYHWLYIYILYVRKYEHQEWSRIEHTELEILSIQVLGSMHAFCHIPTWLVAWLSSKGVVVFYCLLQHSVLVILQHYHFHSPQLMIHTCWLLIICICSWTQGVVLS